MDMQPWHYFLSLERDLARTIDFVEIDNANSCAFSNEFVKLLLLVGSEVDVMAKILCAKAAPDQRYRDIVDYRNILTSAFKGIHTIEMLIPRYRLAIKPWSDWDPAIAKSPGWWAAYNDVKHERDKNFRSANQRHVLEAFSGLMALLLYHYGSNFYFHSLPQLLWCEGFQHSLTSVPNFTPPGA